MIDPRTTTLNFILSTGRTGSTLLSSMLNMHPEIISVSEEPFSYNLYPKYKDRVHWDEAAIAEFCHDFYLFSEGKLEPQFGKKEDLVRILTEHKQQLTGELAIKLAYFAFFPNKDKSRVSTIVDKQLIFHHYLQEVSFFYPASKFILLSRDPRDNVVIKQRRAVKKKKRPSLIIFAKTWNYEYTTLEKKLSRISPDRVMRVRYEDLVSSPEEVLRKITAFLKVPYVPELLNYDQRFKEELGRAELIGNTVKKHLTMFHEGLTQKVSTDKVGLWKKELSSEDNNIIWTICGRTALREGYEAEGCREVPYLRLRMVGELCRFFYNNVLVPGIYMRLPFRIKYLIKKRKYRKHFKDGIWSTQDFYNSSLPGK